MRSAEPAVRAVSADISADVATAAGPASDASDQSDAGTDTAAALRARGLRMTQQRARVEEAVRRLGHATPEQIAEHLATDSPPLPLSTVYRALDALERVGAVSHGHLEQRAPTYHLVSHADHLHLRCAGCGAVAEADVDAAADLVRTLARRHGFAADVGHLVIPGRCRACDDADSDPVEVTR